MAALAPLPQGNPPVARRGSLGGRAQGGRRAHRWGGEAATEGRQGREVGRRGRDVRRRGREVGRRAANVRRRGRDVRRRGREVGRWGRDGYFPPDLGIGTAASGTSEAAALGASASVLSGAGESALSGTVSASASHTFTLDSGASRSFFRDRTTLTPLSRPVAVSLADPSGGPVLSRFSTVLPCPAAPSGTLTGLYLPSFSTNLVSGADLQDAGVHQFTPARQRVTHCTEADTGRHLATFTRRPGSSLYTLTTASPPGAESGRVPSSGQVFAAASRSGPESAPCSCRRLSHETLLWHHRLGHPSLLRLRGMASRVLVSGLPRSLPPLPPGPCPTCVPCVEGRQRAAPHSSQFPPTEAPLQTLHMDVWGPARVRGQGQERYFLLVVDDYSRYTTVFPLRSKEAESSPLAS
ncbi:unnamed protein product [Closterium sp. NIES-64]|nr:unnamed protein product [Closterium sp. NIES-64]